MYIIFLRVVPGMHINKNGHVFLTIFFITTMILFATMFIIRSCSTKKIIARQQYSYWQTYYTCEGCLEYIVAYFCQHSDIPPEILFSYQKNEPYTIAIKQNHLSNQLSLKGTIEYKGTIIALWELILEKHENTWLIQKRTITLKFLY